MNKTSPVLPTRPAFAFQGQTTKRRPSPTLHTTKTRRSSHSNSTADRALVAAAAAAAVAAAVVLQRPKLCSTGAAHGKLWAVCFVWHYTTPPATVSATAKLLPPFKSHFEVYYASADRSLTRKSMQRKRKQRACRTFLGQTKCCKCTIINGNETNFPSF